MMNPNENEKKILRDIVSPKRKRYAEIGVKYGITKQQVSKIAIKNGIRRQKPQRS